MGWLFTITFFLKLGGAFLFSQLLFRNYPSVQLGLIAVDSGDTFSYLGAIDNLITYGEYFFWIGDQQKVYAGRMPYYGAPYFLLRQFLDQSVAYDIYVVLQIAIDALATVVFAKLCFDIFQRKRAFWIGFLVHFFSLSFILQSRILWTESLSLSFLVFFLYFAHCFWTQKKWNSAGWASVFLALLTVLKPYFVLIYPIFFLFVWFILKRNEKERLNFSRALSFFYKTMLLGLPLMMLLAPWIIRNAVVLGRFIPSQQDFYAGYNYGKAHLAFTEFAGAWGAGSVFWEPKEAGCYFLINSVTPCNYSLPDYALADSYTREDVERVRQNFFELQKNYSIEFDDKVAAEFEELTKIYKQERPFMYQVGARFLFFWKLFFHSSEYNFPLFKNSGYYWIFQYLFKAFQIVIHFSLLILGTFGLLELVYKRKVSFIFILIPLFVTILFLELRTTERRYVEHVYPFLLIGLTLSLLKSSEKLKTFKISNRFNNLIYGKDSI